MAVKPNRIESKIVSELRKIGALWQKTYPSVSECTRQIKNRIGNLGNSLGFQVYCSQCKYDKNGEWLFDLTWTRETKHTLKSLILALESEWNRSEVIDDFEKLLVARANHRVMILWEKTHERAAKLFQVMINEIKSSDLTIQGDRYLFACWIEKAEYFDMSLFIAGDKVAIPL